MIGVSALTFGVSIMPKPSKDFLSFLLGGSIGYWACAFLGALENHKFHTIRSWVTGCSDKYAMKSHPAYDYIAPTLLVLFMVGGGTISVLISRYRKRKAERLLSLLPKP